MEQQTLIDQLLKAKQEWSLEKQALENYISELTNIDQDSSDTLSNATRNDIFGLYRLLQDYVSTDSNYLSVKQGELVMVLEKTFNNPN